MENNEGNVIASVLPKGCRQKKNSILKDIVQIGGGEVNPMSKIGKEMNF